MRPLNESRFCGARSSWANSASRCCWPAATGPGPMRAFTATPQGLVFLRRFSRSAAPNLKPNTKFIRRTAERARREMVLFVFFLPFFVGFVPFVLGRLVAATLR